MAMAQWSGASSRRSASKRVGHGLRCACAAGLVVCYLAAPHCLSHAPFPARSAPGMAANQFKARKEWRYIEYPDASRLTPHGLHITRVRYEPKLQKMVRRCPLLYTPFPSPFPLPTHLLPPSCRPSMHPCRARVGTWLPAAGSPVTVPCRATVAVRSVRHVPQLVCEARTKKLKVYVKGAEPHGAKAKRVDGVVSLDREAAQGNSIAGGLNLFCELECVQET